VNIRTFQRGDETHQVAIYNEAAAALPRFKPATTQEMLRRVSARDFDASTRFFAIEGDQPVAYATFHANGRVSYPWCRPGHEVLAAPLFKHALQAMRQRGLRKAFAAYRADWPTVLDFLGAQGFAVARDMVNFLLDVHDMPTVPGGRPARITPLERGDVPALFALAPHVVRCKTAAELETQLFANPYFEAGSLFVLRSREGSPQAAGLLITDPTYADPRTVDAAMPCFRLGAFGTEGMQTKRLKGMFSFLSRDEPNCGALAVDLVAHASKLLHDNDEINALAAQVPSDAPHLLRFYQLRFRRQGSFPVLERAL
jgi:hypothetical protein